MTMIYAIVSIIIGISATPNFISPFYDTNCLQTLLIFIFIAVFWPILFTLWAIGSMIQILTEGWK